MRANSSGGTSSSSRSSIQRQPRGDEPDSVWLSLRRRLNEYPALKSSCVQDTQREAERKEDIFDTRCGKGLAAQLMAAKAVALLAGEWEALKRDRERESETERARGRDRTRERVCLSGSEAEAGSVARSVGRRLGNECKLLEIEFSCMANGNSATRNVPHTVPQAHHAQHTTHSGRIRCGHGRASA